MSHFTVLIPAKDTSELEAKLLPYHEYECTGIEQYLQFVPYEDFEKEYEQEANGRSREEFAEDYYGSHAFFRDGVLGRMTNPSAKWDWWGIGGRWTGTLHLKAPSYKVGAGSGTPGLMTSPNRDPFRADYAQVKDVDFEGMRKEATENALKNWKVWADVISLVIAPDNYLATEDKRAVWDSIRQSIFEGESGHMKDAYHDAIFFEPLGDTAESHAGVVANRARTYAFIDLDGKWNQRGQMGWFGFDDPERGTPDYDKAWWDFVSSLEPNQMIYIVDCHI